LFVGQFVSLFGSMLSYVALPYVLYQSTKSTMLTGLLGVIQLAPSVVGALFGGALADAIDRRRLIVICEAAMAFVVLGVGLAVRLHAPGYPPAIWLLAAAALLAVINGIHRPALEALTSLLVPKSEMPAAATLSSFQHNLCMIGGPAVAGILLGIGGADLAFDIDFASFAIAVGCLFRLRAIPSPKQPADLTLESRKHAARCPVECHRDSAGDYPLEPRGVVRRRCLCALVARVSRLPRARDCIGRRRDRSGADSGTTRRGGARSTRPNQHGSPVQCLTAALRLGDDPIVLVEVG
jgi:MFS family permease